jgi:hypothetical protein
VYARIPCSGRTGRSAEASWIRSALLRRSLASSWPGAAQFLGDTRSRQEVLDFFEQVVENQA